MKHRILSLLMLALTAIAYAQPSIDAGGDVYTCQGQPAQLSATVTGGTPPYTYQWSPAGSLNNPFIANPVATITVTTTYSLTVTDNNGLIAIDTVRVNVMNSLSIQGTINNVSCHGGSDGTIDITVTGGNAPYTYLWSHATTTEDQTGLWPGVYLLTVTDNSGCTQMDSFIITEPDQLTESYTNVVGATCGASDGAACIVVTGGTAPYTYLWGNGSTASCASGLAAPSISTTVIDANGCTAAGITPINSVGSTIVITSTITNVSCHGGNDGTIDITVTGGNAPYTYLWSHATTTEDQMGLWANMYLLTVTDNSGCTEMDSFIVLEPSSVLSISQVPAVHTSCYQTDNGAACVIVVGGTSPYAYSWSTSPPSTTQCIDHLETGTYNVTVADANNCTVSGNTFVNPTVSMPLVTVDAVFQGDGTLPDTLLALATGGIPPYRYFWQSDASTDSFLIISSTGLGMERVFIADANECGTYDSVYINCPDTCVWPGDADYSSIADNNDLLAIGLGYGTTGPARFDQSIIWSAHQTANWTDYLGYVANYKHIDCNGDGVINSDDTLAIVQNYGFTNPRSGADEIRANVPALRVRLVPDTLIDGQTVLAHLELGDNVNLATDVYGLAFTFNFDPLLVDTNEVYIAYDNSSWLCSSAADHIDIDKKDAAAGKLYTALTRIDHTTRSGSGHIGNVSMKITTGNINGKDLSYYKMDCYITDLTVIDNMGNKLEVDAIGDSSAVAFEPTGINEVNWKGEVMLYPNPARQQLMVSSSMLPVSSLQVTNLLGETVLVQQGLNSNKAVLDIAILADGVYILKLNSGSSIYHTRFVVAK